ncbi:protein TRM32 isoform X2 [Eutrema salsugineum]|uniref:protein TRM32 isoform X2 n=1 Tax=Eutrema salsugineum TaxID=72664 RepID=UPI000CECFC93|nr:protein TRM32 isoform X2 [Eutrema salsugineum]
MGKNLRHKVTCSPIQNHPGFMWGLFDILKHNHWRYIKKRLPHKRPICRRSAGTENEVNNTCPSPNGIPVPKSKVEDTINDSGQRPKKPSSAVKSKESKSGGKTKKQHNSEEKSKKLNSEEKSRKTHSEIKRSVKALIKALVIEDKSKSKKKGRHHRSSTYPVQSNPKEKESLSEVESSDKNSSNGDERNRVFNKTIGISPAIGSLNPLYLMSEESSNSDSEEFRLENTPAIDTDENKSDFEESDSKKNEKNDEEEAWFDPKLRNTKEFSENEDDTSPRRSKACLDALNLIHMNRNFLLKVLQDPGSPLARHFQSQQSFSSKTITKAGSFPTHGSNREDHNNGFESVGDIEKKPASPSIAAEHRADGIQKLNESMVNFSDEDLSGFGYARKRGKNQVVIKRFKDLRQKIKHVINENKNEKHRITMDAVLDKVPRKYGFSKDLGDDIFTHLKGKSASKNNIAEGTKLKQIRRTSSLCGSLDRYLQLYESSLQREAKSINTSEKSKVESEESVLPSKRVPKILGRILSLPEMKSPYAFKIEDLPGQFATSSRSIEQEKGGLEDILEISEEHSQSSEHEILETVEDPLSSNAKNPTLMIEVEHDREISTLDVEPETKSLNESLGDSPTFDENASEAPIPRESETQQDPDTETVSRSKHLEIIAAAEAMDEVLQIEAQDKVKFNYVRDILEISGFNAPESLSMWQSDYQPLDPLVYEEATTTKGCMIQDPECSTNQEGGGNCNHLLLFDLINEVLIEIYERSYHYCPKPLSSLCRIHPMSVGYSVLKEVWVRISCYLRYKPHDEQSFDKIMSRDLSRDDGWMDLQFESECVGIEVEDLIFEELLEELLVSG